MNWTKSNTHESNKESSVRINSYCDKNETEELCQLSASSSLQIEDESLANEFSFVELENHEEDLSKKNCITDLCLEVGGETFAVHRAVITFYSNYIKKKIVQYSNSQQIKIIHLNGICPKALEILLQYMYKGDFNPSSGLFYEIIVAATKLQIDDVLNKCIQCLNTEDEDLRKHLFIFNLAKNMKLTEKYENTLILLTNRFEETVINDQFLELDAEGVIELLSADIIGARSEIIVFMAAVRWLDYDYKARQQFEAIIMGCVRYSGMTMEEMIACFVPPIRPEVIENPEVRIQLLSGLCYLTAKARGQERPFEELCQQSRTLLISGEPMELWVIN